MFSCEQKKRSLYADKDQFYLWQPDTICQVRTEHSWVLKSHSKTAKHKEYSARSPSSVAQTQDLIFPRNMWHWDDLGENDGRSES